MISAKSCFSTMPSAAVGALDLVLADAHPPILIDQPSGEPANAHVAFERSRVWRKPETRLKSNAS
jgi:hypothetical protein